MRQKESSNEQKTIIPYKIHTIEETSQQLSALVLTFRNNVLRKRTETEKEEEEEEASE